MQTKTHLWMRVLVLENRESEITWTPISELTVDSQTVNVQFKVLEKEKPRRVVAKSSGRPYQICNCVVGDSTGVITLTLWNEDIENLELFKTYELVNGYVTIYDECMNLGKGRQSELRESVHEIVDPNLNVNMSIPFMGKPRRRKKKRSKTGRTFSGISGRERRGYPARKSF
ncbi:MAG: hypothetical protein ACFFCP_09470 [Promethearchaeota archaeon]